MIIRSAEILEHLHFNYMLIWKIRVEFKIDMIHPEP